ncbi:MAG: hypothetical protein O3C21_00340 [Verrucomicrobia bacterium]|nr:hypothetical protein [Verrucomicrobiota bacterium]
MKITVLCACAFIAWSPAYSATLMHRYSFSGGTEDSVGGNAGVLEGGATVGDSALILTGAGSSTSANRMEFSEAVDIGTNFGETGVTIEAWYTDAGTGTWGKLFQFGQNEAGFELAYTHTRGNGEQSGVDRGGAKLFGEQISQNEEHHLVISVGVDGQLNTWLDGDLKLEAVETTPTADIGQGGGANFEAIGATSWGDPGMNGTVNEFRIWAGELTADEVASNLAAGPDSVPGAYAAAVLQDEPVSYWRFDDGGGTATDSGATETDGTYVGVTQVDGYHGLAASFADAPGNSHIDFGEAGAGSLAQLVNDDSAGSQDPDQKTTLEFWMKTSQEGQDASNWRTATVFGEESPGDGDIQWGYILPTGQLGAIAVNDQHLHVSDDPINDNEWHHVAVTYDWSSFTSQLYVDGELKSDLQGGANVFTDSDAHIRYMGWNSLGQGGKGQYIGLLDEVAIYDKILPAERIEAHASIAPTAALDSDGDGLPDAWEQEWFGNLNQTGDADADADGLTNAEELAFSFQLNPNKADTDSDLLTDGEEVKTYKSDPRLADSDGDTLTDGAEVKTHKTNPLLTDSDMDLYPDGLEIATNTNPNDPNDPPPLTMAQLAHRYSYNAGAELTDSVGGNDGILFSTAVVEDNQLKLDGAGSGGGATSMRFTDPVDIGGNFAVTGVSVEAWYTDSGSGTWAKLFTFGTSQAGQEFAWTNFRGGGDVAPGLDRNGAHGIDSIPFGSGERLTEDEEHHLVVSVGPEGTTNLWIDGLQEITELETNPVSNIVTTTESIGSTAWGDPGHSGTVNEFRIWRGTLTADEVATNLALGPDTIGEASPFEIVSAAYDAGAGTVELLWNSVAGRTYAVDASPDLSAWTEIDDSIVGAGETTSYQDTPPAGTQERYYRVKDIGQ